eukprot:scaffold47_cov334-Pavlova_lutheri.AAC.8
MDRGCRHGVAVREREEREGRREGRHPSAHTWRMVAVFSRMGGVARRGTWHVARKGDEGKEGRSRRRIHGDACEKERGSTRTDPIREERHRNTSFSPSKANPNAASGPAANGEGGLSYAPRSTRRQWWIGTMATTLGWTSHVFQPFQRGAMAAPPPPAPGRVRYLGLATSSSSYGGYGGNENSEDRYKYYYDVPEDWDQATVNKIEKATNGTDSKWTSKKRGGGNEKIYLVTFPGYSTLKAQRGEIMNDLAISDYDLQDILSGAEDVKIHERQVEGITYVDYDIYSYKTNVLASVAADGGRLYAWFCWIPTSKWEQDEKMARELRDSFGVIQRGTEAEIKANLEFYKRS